MNEQWQWTRLGDICRTSSGGTPLRDRAEYFEGGEIPWLMSGEVAQGDVTESERFITRLGMQNSSAKLFPVNTVLVAMYGATAGQVGVLRIEATTNQAVCGIFPSRHFAPEFLYYFLLGKKSELVARATGNAQPNISQAKIKDTLVPLLPLEEQRQIVTLLDEAFAAIATAAANAEKNLANARELFENSTSALLNGSEWPTRSLDEVCAITSKLVDPRLPDFIDLPHVGAGNMESRTGAISGLMTAREEKLVSGKFLFDASTVLYSKIRPYLMKTCRPGFAGLCSADVYPLTTVADKLDRDFLFHVLMSREFTTYAEAGSARSGMPKVNRDHLFAYQIRLPALEIQRQIAGRIDAIADGCAQASSLQEAKLAALAKLKQSLLHRAFTGELTAAMPETIAA